MSFFNINGWNVPIVNGGMSETSTQYGNSGKSFTNRALIRRRMNPRTWSGSMLFQTPSVADTVEGLLMGRGHHFPLNTNFWSDSGVAPTSLASKSIVEGGGLQRFGTGHASFTADMSFDVGFPTKKWTVIVWADNTGSGEWHQHVETATGDTYQDGVATAVTSFITVADGIVTIDYTNFPAGTVSKDMDDLVLLPFNVDASFVADLYAWQNDNGVVMQCPFDYPGDFADRVNGVEGVPTSDNIAAGNLTRKSGDGALLNTDATDNVEFPVSLGDPIELNTDDEITVCFWVNPSAGSLLVASPDLAEQFAVTHGWVFSMATGNARVFYQLDGTSAAINDPDTLVADEWAHLTMVYSSPTTTPTLSLYKNGVLVGTDTATPDSAQFAENIYIGDKAAVPTISGDSALCSVDDFRYYRQALDVYQIAEIYQKGLYGYDFIPPQDRAFSKLPRLLVSGDCIGSQHPKEVIGKVDSEAYVQHGGTYSSNDRSINLILQEVSPVQEGGVSRPDANFILEPEFVIDQLNGPYSLDAAGGYLYQKKLAPAAPTLVYDIDDGFGFCQSFDPAASQGFDLPSDHSGLSNLSSDLGGHSGVSVGAWIYVENMTVGSILNIPIKAGSSFSKVALNVHTDGGGSIQWGGRSEIGDSFEGLTSNTDVVSTGEWYFILGTLDLPNATASIYANVASKTMVSLLDEAAGLSFGRTTFSAENGGTGAGTTHGSAIGTNDVPQNFDGKIKSVMIWKRVIEMDEIVTTFRKGYDRRIFR